MFLYLLHQFFEAWHVYESTAVVKQLSLLKVLEHERHVAQRGKQFGGQARLPDVEALVAGRSQAAIGKKGCKALLEQRGMAQPELVAPCLTIVAEQVHVVHAEHLVVHQHVEHHVFAHLKKCDDAFRSGGIGIALSQPVKVFGAQKGWHAKPLVQHVDGRVIVVGHTKVASHNENVAFAGRALPDDCFSGLQRLEIEAHLGSHLQIVGFGEALKKGQLQQPAIEILRHRHGAGA